jgi:sn-glycerol 3-phosphate transport system permease protein
VKEQTRRRLRRCMKRLPGDLLKIAVVLCFVFPFYWMICTAFKSYSEAIQTPVTFWPERFSMDGVASILGARNVDVLRYLRNSILITAGTIALQMLLLVPAAYAFARFEFFGKNVCFALVLLALMIPGQVTYITVYLTMADWNLLNTLWPQILPHGANAFGIFLLRQGFKQVPDEIIESAQLDSASQVQIILKILAPMCKSVLLTIMLFSFVTTWNNYFWPLVMTNSEAVRPLTMMLVRVLDSELGTRWNEIMAANLLVVIPVLAVYIFTSGRIIKAFTYNGIK